MKRQSQEETRLCPGQMKLCLLVHTVRDNLSPVGMEDRQEHKLHRTLYRDGAGMGLGNEEVDAAVGAVGL